MFSIARAPLRALTSFNSSSNLKTQAGVHLCQSFWRQASSQAVHKDNVQTETGSVLDQEVSTVPPHIEAIVDQIKHLKFYEVTLLNEALKRELKIPDSQRFMAAGPASDSKPAEDDGSAAGVKSAYTVKLTKFDESKKVALIKEIKKLVEGMNLVEAKRFVESVPKVIKAGLTKEEAETLQKQLEAAGGVTKLE